AILDPTTAPVSCESSPIEDSLAISASLDGQSVAAVGGGHRATAEVGPSATITGGRAVAPSPAQQQQQQHRPTAQKLTIKTVILGSPATVSTVTGGGSSTSSSSSSSPSSSSPSSSVPSPAPSIGVRFGLGGGKPSAAALRRGPGRPKKDFIPLLKMSASASTPSAGASGSSSFGASASTTTTTTTMVKLGGASVGGGGSSPSSEHKIVKRYKNTNVVRGGIPKRKVELAAIALHDSTASAMAAMANARSPPAGTSSTLAAPLSSPTGGFGSLLSSPTDDGGQLGGGGPSTANSSVASTPTAEVDADPALLMPAPDEMPYFPEKYPGKVCILCNLGERSQLGQGEMLRIEMTLAADQIASALSQDEKGFPGAEPAAGDSFGDKSPKASGLGPPQFGGSKRQKGSNKCKNPIANPEYTDELEKIGHLEVIDSSISDGGYFYIHRSCALWSYGVGRDLASGTLSNLEVVVVQSLSRRCHFCAHFGASLSCKMSCPKWYHFPCVAASGGFQVIQTYSIFCKEHLGQVPLVCTEDINCRQCSALGDVGNLVMCSLCGDHYHGTCVGLAQLPGVRTGWQCNSCKKCQICRVPDASEGRSVACELCDKIYHASCLRPIMTSIPKLGWKCRCCRVCSDCGARTPGAGASSRWHSHYTVCDSCYQQRNKGFSCPICFRAYRAAAHREMVKCSVCYKFVHSTCDPDADLSAYHGRKEANPDYEYLCNPCKTAIHNGRMAAAQRRSSGSVDDDSMSLSQDSLNDDAMEVDGCAIGGEAGRDAIRERLERSGSSDVGLGKGKPYVASKIAKKRLGLSLSGALGGLNRPKGIGKGFQKKTRLADITRKRGSKAKMRGIFGVPGLGLQRPTADLVATMKANEDEPGGENRLVLCSAKDKFVLTQDICVMCGAIGTDQEGCLIACTQCGQCYHPYCTNVKVTKVILQKGWRCLDCTICEGCGQRNDEARLILCDDCDISYHIYCMDPPLEHVPQGTWKCKWCAICLKCGTNSPGFNCSWMNSYTECGPCASQSNCPSCNEGYAEGELIIQCHQCERWLHCACDQIKSEAEADRCAEEGYNCLICRPPDQPPPHLVPKRKSVPSVTIATIIPPVPTPKSTPKLEEKIMPLALEGNHYLDGVCLSEHGLHQIKALQAEFGKRGKRKPKLPVEPPPAPGKDAAILAAIESVVAGSSHDNSLEDMRLEPLDPKEEAEIYKDGMVWNDPTPPEGFALFTTESGTVVLRKKRQRNLQKLGIGGFFVRNRGVRTKDGKEEEDMVDGGLDEAGGAEAAGGTKPKKKPIRRKPKSKLIEIYPNILQDAFFGRSLLSASMPSFDAVPSDDDVKSDVSDDKTVKLSAEELKLFEAVKTKEEEINSQSKEQSGAGPSHPPKNQPTVGQPSKAGRRTPSAAAQAQLPVTGDNGSATPSTGASSMSSNGAVNVAAGGSGSSASGAASTVAGAPVGAPSKMEEDDNSDTEALKDVLGLPTDFNEDEFVSQIIGDDELTKNSTAFDDLATGTELGDSLAKSSKDELVDILSPHFDMANFNQMDNKMVEDLFKTVLTDESQESQESMLAGTMTPYTSNTSTPSHTTDVMLNEQQAQAAASGMVMQPNPGPQMTNTMSDPTQCQSPVTGTSQPQMQQAGQWQNQNVQLVPGAPSMDASTGPLVRGIVAPSGGTAAGVGEMVGGTLDETNMKSAQKLSEKMRKDEMLGDMATISSVLYCNMRHPELKAEYPNWNERWKQISKRWRLLSNEDKQPFLQHARDNRSASKMKKTQQVFTARAASWIHFLFPSFVLSFPFFCS
uniref:PHD-type domain-containing protein n=1 Tax=Anopheles atroparvus TaxID=41427 RepID=A0A182ILT4_ANOAO